MMIQKKKKKILIINKYVWSNKKGSLLNSLVKLIMKD